MVKCVVVAGAIVFLVASPAWADIRSTGASKRALFCPKVVLLSRIDRIPGSSRMWPSAPMKGAASTTC